MFKGPTYYTCKRKFSKINKKYTKICSEQDGKIQLYYVKKGKKYIFMTLLRRP